MKVLVALGIILAMAVAGPQLGGGDANANAGADAESQGEIGLRGKSSDGDQYAKVCFNGPHSIEGGSANANADSNLTGLSGESSYGIDGLSLRLLAGK